jgi:hypothetical protein
MTGCYLDQRKIKLNHYDLTTGRRLFSDCPSNFVVTMRNLDGE